VRAATLVLFLLTLAQLGLTAWGNYRNRALFDALEQRIAEDIRIATEVAIALVHGEPIERRSTSRARCRSAC
jgi:hypothetical protein